MYKLRMHCRGGQGGKTGVKILADAFFLEGMDVQAFSIYGAERRGAPVASFLRVDEKKIYERGYIEDPDCVIILDDSLLKVKEELGIYKGLKKGGGCIIINTTKKVKPPRGIKLLTIDASSIAKETMNRDVVNVAILGAYAAFTKKIGMKSLEQAVYNMLGEKYKEWVAPNIKAMNKVYNEAIKQLKK
jgi:pyruvate ferredoxin oxidoreductase gamma subunit